MKTVSLTEDQAVRPYYYEMIVGEQLPFNLLMRWEPDSADWQVGDGLELISTSIIGREVSAMVKAKQPSQIGYNVGYVTQLVCKTTTTSHADPHHAESVQKKFIFNIRLVSEVN